MNQRLNTLLTHLKQHPKITIGIIGLILTTFIISGYNLVRANNPNPISPIPETKVLGTSIPTPIPTIIAEPQTTGILLAGYGGAGHDGPYLLDAIQILYADPDLNTLALISIPRDTLITYPDNRQRKINQALSYGLSTDKTSNLADASHTATKLVSQITGLPINSFVGADFVGFKRIIGQEFANLNVTATITVNDPWYPIRGEEVNPCGKSDEEITELTRTMSGFNLEKQFPCRYQHINIKPGEIIMDGSLALAYARSRHGSSDFDRSRRQQDLLKSIATGLLKLETVKGVPHLISQFGQHTSYNLEPEQLNNYLSTLKLLFTTDIKQINLSTDNVLQSQGPSNLIPKAGDDNWSQVHSHIQSQL